MGGTRDNVSSTKAYRHDDERQVRIPLGVGALDGEVGGEVDRAFDVLAHQHADNDRRHERVCMRRCGTVMIHPNIDVKEGLNKTEKRMPHRGKHKALMSSCLQIRNPLKRVSFQKVRLVRFRACL